MSIFKPTSIMVARELHALHQKSKKKNEKDLTPLQLILLTVLVNGWSYVFTGGALVGEPVRISSVPMPNDDTPPYPTFRNLHNAVERWRRMPVHEFPEPAAYETVNRAFTPEEKKVIGAVYKSYGGYNGSQLLRLLEDRPDAPWKKNMFTGFISMIFNDGKIRGSSIRKTFEEWDEEISKNEKDKECTKFVAGDINEKMA